MCISLPGFQQLLQPGWFGFNAGSALSSGALAASAFVVTNIAAAAAAAALSWMTLSWSQNRKPSAMGTVTGAVCGLVAITPASGFVGPIAAIAIGIIAGVVTYLALYFRSKKINVDDTLDVWATRNWRINRSNIDRSVCGKSNKPIR